MRHTIIALTLIGALIGARAVEGNQFQDISSPPSPTPQWQEVAAIPLTTDLRSRHQASSRRSLAKRKKQSRLRRQISTLLEVARQEQVTHWQKLHDRAMYWPTVNPKINSHFHVLRPTHVHQGIDLAGKLGDPVLAAGTGVVTSIKHRGNYGWTVTVKHPNGLETLYAHVQQIIVRVGQHVRQRQRIAAIGQNGNATGPNLHFEIRRGSSVLDPLAHLPRPGGRQ